MLYNVVLGFHTITPVIHAMLGGSVVSDSASPWTVAGQAPLSMEIIQARILEWVAMPSNASYTQFFFVLGATLTLAR